MNVSIPKNSLRIIHKWPRRIRYLTYQQTKQQVYQIPYGYKRIRCIYTDFYVSKEKWDTDPEIKELLNVEHLVPQSMFSNYPQLSSDLHYIFPSLRISNSLRGNYVFGEVDKHREVVITSKKLYHSPGALMPGDRIPDKIEVNTTKPQKSIKNATMIDNRSSRKKKRSFSSDCAIGKCLVDPLHRGVVSRAVLYFVYRYHNYNRLNPDLGKFLSPQRVATLVNWSIQEPVTQREHQRNKDVHSLQANWNYLIGYADGRGYHPCPAQLITFLFGNRSTRRKIGQAIPSTLHQYLEGISPFARG